MSSREEELVALLHRRSLWSFDNVTLSGSQLRTICKKFDIYARWVDKKAVYTFCNGTISCVKGGEDDRATS
jgi:hypothetical protein